MPYLFFRPFDPLQHAFNTLLVNLNTKGIPQMIDLLVNVQRRTCTQQVKERLIISFWQQVLTLTSCISRVILRGRPCGTTLGGHRVPWSLKFFLYVRIVRSHTEVSLAIVLSCCFSSILTVMTSFLNSGMAHSMTYKISYQEQKESTWLRSQMQNRVRDTIF